MSNPVMTLRWMIDGEEEQPDLAQVLWTTCTEDGYMASLMSIPDMGYTIVKHDDPFTDGQAISFDDISRTYIELGRPDAGQLAVALITALINNSDQIIDYYIEKMTARRSNPPRVTA